MWCSLGIQAEHWSACVVGVRSGGLPISHRIHTVLGQMDVRIDVIDPGHREQVMLPVRAVVLGQFDQVAFDVINDTDLLAARRDHIHMLFDAIFHDFLLSNSERERQSSSPLSCAKEVTVCKSLAETPPRFASATVAPLFREVL
jgi:hypothetical protein